MSNFIPGFRRFAIHACALSTLLLSTAATADPIRIQLSWQHQFEFAGYYAALSQGYYQDAGLEVELLEGKPDQRPLESVLGSEAEFGIGGSELLHAHMQGTPITAVAGIFQHSPMVLLIKRSHQINTPEDLHGQTVMLQDPLVNLPIKAMLSRAGVDLSQINFEYSSQAPGINTANKYAAFSAYLSNEPYLLRQFNTPFLMLDPVHFGIDFYGDMLFTRQDYLRKNPQQVRKIREATLKGWEYALDHPDEIVQLIRSRYNPARNLEHLNYEANVLHSLIMPDLVELGYINPERLQKQAAFLQSEGLSTGQLDTESFIYDPSPQGDIQRWRNIALITLGLLGLVVIIGGILLNLHLRLKFNIEARRKAEKGQYEERAMFEATFFSTPLATVVSDNQRRIKMSNPAFKKRFGYSDEVLNHLSAEDLYVRKNDFRHITNNLQHIHTHTATEPYEAQMLTSDGQIFPAEVQAAPILTADDRQLGYVAVIHDLSEIKTSQAEVERMAMSDSLTGLANRRAFDLRLRELLQLAQRQALRISVLMLDLDKFKPVNDTYGHPVGDKVLIAVAHLLSQVFRESDIVARFGGDEFAVLLVSPLEQAFSPAPLERIITELQKPLQIDDLQIQIGASAGCAHFPENTANLIELMKQADEALYDAKEHGRNRYVIHPVNAPA